MYIKSVLNLKCKVAVEDKSVGNGVRHVYFELNEAQLLLAFSPEQLSLFKDVLSVAVVSQNSQPLVGHQKRELANKIIHAVGDIIRSFDGKVPHINYSHIISKKLNYSYNYLTTVFAEVKGITIEAFIILDKIERAKELILGSNLTFTQIADRLQYSSVSHLSNQFKRVIGITPSQFRKSMAKGK